MACITTHLPRPLSRTRLATSPRVGKSDARRGCKPHSQNSQAAGPAWIFARSVTATPGCNHMSWPSRLAGPRTRLRRLFSRGAYSLKKNTSGRVTVPQDTAPWRDVSAVVTEKGFVLYTSIRRKENNVAWRVRSKKNQEIGFWSLDRCVVWGLVTEWSRGQGRVIVDTAVVRS